MKSSIFALTVGLHFYYFTTALVDQKPNNVTLEYLKGRKLLRLTAADKAILLNMHNEYRSKVSPPAADMKLMVWDVIAEESAQKWADNCEFKHGMPKGYNDTGQNLYIGGDRTGSQAAFLWWDEYTVYDFWKSYCPPDEQCGHYTQMAWADSYLLGCAISQCPEWNLIVCHYRPHGNIINQKPYQVGLPCSQCDVGNGGVCYKNLCVTKNQCGLLKLDCNCPLKCHNCGILNSQQCRCICKEGWDSLDCSRKCEDENFACRKNPGFPNAHSCGLDRRIPKQFCRSMCGQCEEVPPSYPKYFFHPDMTGESGNISELCCGGEVCSKGYVLDKDFCACRTLCPGPLCGQVTYCPQMVVDPILCDILAEKGEWSKLDFDLLSLCKFHGKAKSRNVRDDSKSDSGNRSRLMNHHQEMVVDLHNECRRQVAPSAANMKFMKWDDDLSVSAQKWADKCEFRHGRPAGFEDISIGQNLYVGPDLYGERAVKMWFDEREFYNFEEDECEMDEECGHYIQLVWANSEYVGCAVSKCPKLGYLYVCHYSPRGNQPEVSPYLVGVPCSQCRNRIDGGLCYQNACITSKDCKKYNLKCACNLGCQNCGLLNRDQCHCACKIGWDSLDCSRLCDDSHDSCGQNPGWPNALSCSKEEHKVRDEHCRKMCKQCKVFNDESFERDKKELCCNGTLCEEGMVLDKTCQCQLLCPGSNCLDPPDHFNFEEKVALVVSSDSAGYINYHIHKSAFIISFIVELLL